MQPLTIDPALPEIIRRLAANGCLVLVAEPGAGKTTRIPPALLAAGLAADGEIVVLEPRRLAARLAARRVAEELGEPLGERVGYQVRFEEASSPRTRIRFVTEGILTRRLASDPRLTGVSLVVLDEFHERHLPGDLALALLRRLRRGARPDLRLVVMSATLEAAPVASFLAAERLDVPGRAFPVELEHAGRDSVPPDIRPAELAARVAATLRRLRSPADGRRATPLDGDVLVFLPGASEIRAALQACAGLAEAERLLLVPLHGDLAPAEQDRAVRPAGRPKVILSTNVAETSVTIDGVTTVIDSGLARIARHSPWSGLPSLAVERISQASAAQRAGRAGRTRPGRCIRLFTRPDHDRRPAHDVPEIRRADLADPVLALHASLGPDEALDWLEPPPPAALAAARELLGRLGALDPHGAVTATGRRMLALPLHPRLARLALAAADAGALERGCTLAALLGERDLRVRARADVHGPARTAGHGTVAGPSDLLDRLEAYESTGGRPERAADLELDAGALRAVTRTREQIRRNLVGASDTSGVRTPAPPPRRGSARPVDGDEILLRAALAGFPDRVARRRTRSSEELLLSGGGAARLADTSVVRDAEFLVAVDAEERRDGRSGAPALPRVRLASAIEPEWLLDLFPERVVERQETRFDAKAERVESTSALLYDRLVLHQSHGPGRGPEAERVLAEAARSAGPEAFCDAAALAGWRARLEFAAGFDPGVPTLDAAAVVAALEERCRGRRSFAELRSTEDGGLLGTLRSRLTPAQRSALERFAPERVELPGGRRLPVFYESGKEPWIASRLQDFFGLREGPRVGGGRVALVLHLLAPSRRPVQITTDLAGFWLKHYPGIRRELMRRYPKHAWPEDPRASAPAPPRRR